MSRFQSFSQHAQSARFSQRHGRPGAPPARDIGLGEEQTVFYGVGTLTNGAPNYPGQTGRYEFHWTGLQHVDGPASEQRYTMGRRRCIR